MIQNKLRGLASFRELHRLIDLNENCLNPRPDQLQIFPACLDDAIVKCLCLFVANRTKKSCWWVAHRQIILVVCHLMMIKKSTTTRFSGKLNTFVVDPFPNLLRSLYAMLVVQVWLSYNQCNLACVEADNKDTAKASKKHP